MAPDLWIDTKPHIEAGKMVLGWFHSHPGFGAFFSGIDRSTQAAFFSQPYSLGLVVDPKSQEERLFFGPDSRETTFLVIAGAEEWIKEWTS